MIAIIYRKNEKLPAEALADLLKQDYQDIKAVMNPSDLDAADLYKAVICFGTADDDIENQIKTLPVVRVNTDNDAGAVGSVVIKTPCRAGEIIDEINRIIQVNKSAIEARIKIGLLVLDTKTGVISGLGTEEIRLTEKEQAVLLYLYGKKSETVGKEELLREVWNYAPGVDTHTIETHIYRLRQKIESGAGISGFLITEDNGYRLS